MSKTLATALAASSLIAVSYVPHVGCAQDRDTQDSDQQTSETVEPTKPPEALVQDEEGNVIFRDDAAGFGAKGQLTVSTDAALSFERRTQSNADTTTTISIFPAADYFLMDNISLGGQIGVGFSKAGDSKSTLFRIGPRIGYNFRISPLLSLWPKVGFGYSHTKFTTDTPAGSVDTKNDSVQLNIFVPVMLHPASHFFAGFRPFLDTDLNGDNRATTWGLRLTIGGSV